MQRASAHPAIAAAFFDLVAAEYADCPNLLFEICKTGTAVVMSTHNLPMIKENPSIIYRCQDERMEDITNDFHQLVIVDDTPDTDEITVRYSERMEI